MSDEFEELSTDLEEDEREPTESRESSQSKINIFFQSTIGPSQRQEKMQILSSVPVSDVKYTIAQLFSLDVNDFHLSFGGRTMDPDDIIDNYEVMEGDTILLIPISTAGFV